jgi:hypothetical protein
MPQVDLNGNSTAIDPKNIPLIGDSIAVDAFGPQLIGDAVATDAIGPRITGNSEAIHAVSDTGVGDAVAVVLNTYNIDLTGNAVAIGPRSVSLTGNAMAVGHGPLPPKPKPFAIIQPLGPDGLPCRPCVEEPCTSPDPLTLYSLEGTPFGIIFNCPPGYNCNQSGELHLICCGNDHVVLVPITATATQRLNLLQAAIRECISEMLICGEVVLPPNGGGGTKPNLTFYFNQRQTCLARCPDGTLFRYTVNSGIYLSANLASANSFAYDAACRKAKDHRICLPASIGNGCLDTEYNRSIRVTGNYISRYPNSDQWSIVDGAFPDGLSLENTTVTGPINHIIGTPTAAGAFTFTLRVVIGTFGPAFGDWVEKEYTINIVEITPEMLPPVVVGTPYLVNLVASPGDQENQTWELREGELPDGLELSEAGTISGVPTEATNSTVTIGVFDSALNLDCEKEYTFGLVLLSYWTMNESAASNRADSVNGNTLLVTDSTVGSDTGLIGNAARFNSLFGALAKTTAANSLVIPDSGFSIILWFKKLNAAQSCPLIDFRWTYPSSVTIFSAELNYTPTLLRFNLTDSVAPTLVTLSSTDAAATNTWFMVRAWLDLELGKMKLQINSGAIQEAAFPYVDRAIDHNVIRFGPGFTAAADTNTLIDEAAFFAGVLTDAQAAYIYNSGAGRTLGPGYPGT